MIDQSITLRSGAKMVEIRVAILSDDIPELGETFRVTIERVFAISNNFVPNSLQPKIIKGRDFVNITIKGNDYPHGLFKLSVDMAPNTFSMTRHFDIQEPDEKDIRIQLHIDREYGNDYSFC